MADCRRSAYCLLAFSLASCAFPQDTQLQGRSVQTEPPQKVVLNEVSTVQIPSMPAKSIVAPVFCTQDGGILLRLAMPDTGLEDPVSVSGDGKVVIRFGSDKVNDISRPVLLSTFLIDKNLYVLTKGSIPRGYETKWRTPSGAVVSQEASTSRLYIVRFELDGSYAGAVPLDIDFKPMHFGVFENGDFLVEGTDKSISESRVAIVGSNGQLIRFIELRGCAPRIRVKTIRGK
jgi:hypothetical protein